MCDCEKGMYDFIDFDTGGDCDEIVSNDFIGSKKCDIFGLYYFIIFEFIDCYY